MGSDSGSGPEDGVMEYTLNFREDFTGVESGFLRIYENGQLGEEAPLGPDGEMAFELDKNVHFQWQKK